MSADLIEISNDATGRREPSKRTALRAVLPDGGRAPDMPDAEKAARELNKNHALALIGGDPVVLRETRDESGNCTVQYLAPGALKTWLLNETVPVEKISANGNSRTVHVNVADIWLKSKDRRQYEGVTFDPAGNAPAKYYNLWRGFAVRQIDGDPRLKCGKILRHMKYVLCGGNHEHFLYLLAWAADILRDPGIKKGVALVMRGLKGTGKSTLADVLCRMLGQHAMRITHMRHLTGNFNRHLSDKLLIVAEESFWAGDKADEGPLKSIITDPTITIEAKGVDAIEMRSMCRLVMVTNNKWAVPATEDERRYFVLDVSDSRKGARQYFEDLYAEINGDGPAALFTYLLGVDLSAVNVRRAPETSALRKQRLHSLEPHHQFIHDALHEGMIDGRVWSDGASIEKEALYNAYIEVCRKRGKHHLLGIAQFGKEFIAATGAKGSRPRSIGGRSNVYLLPAISDAVATFSEMLKVDIDIGA